MKEYTVVTFDGRVVVRALWWGVSEIGGRPLLAFYDVADGGNTNPCATFLDWYSVHSGDCIVSETRNA